MLWHIHMHIKCAGVTVPMQEKESEGPVIPLWIIRKLKRPSESIGAGNKRQVKAKLHFFWNRDLAFICICAVRSCLAALALDFPILALCLAPERGFANCSLTFFSPRLEKMKRDGDERLGATKESCTFPEMEIRLRWEDFPYTGKKLQIR